ncbi:serine protease [Streptomyces sp. NBC_00038]|uniref:S1 family peptidase n=1 Tax=Streptomyces sp. NBC_00038 TaxID=2903615 RepID=UPI00225159E7|nr:serine protease [Streptomyces sp. NBC_00038]MCX5559529.1 serine protease [Streptomyces sp. NBC_00038]
MTSAGYWVDLYQGQQRLGGGFLVNRQYVLTALHCLSELTAFDADLIIVLADGTRVEGKVCSQDKEADLALIEIFPHFEVAQPIPVTGVAQGGDRWRSPYRPAGNEVELSGRIDNGALPYLCEGGAEIKALQLTANQQLGRYSGYSGGPVEGIPQDREPTLVGILLEQVPDRADPRSGRNTNVLFAATMGEAMRRFPQLDVEHLMDKLRPGRPERVPQRDSEEGLSPLAQTDLITRIETVIHHIQQLSDHGVMDPTSTERVKFLAVKLIMQQDPGVGEA